MKKTDKQIAKAIAQLEKLKPRIRRRSAFGDDHHAAIDAQIDVMRNDLADDEIWSRHQDRDECDAWSESVREAALEARRWMDFEEDASPVDGWKELAEA